MLLPRTDAGMGNTTPVVPINQSTVQRQSLCLAGKSAEPVVHATQLAQALHPATIANFRPLLPVGYKATVQAYQSACNHLTAEDLSHHYTKGLTWFQDVFIPYVKNSLHCLSGNILDFSNYNAYAAGSDVDFITHIVNAVAATSQVTLFPNDWFGFKVGSCQQSTIIWSEKSQGSMACLCVPSVRNGHITEEMLHFLQQAESCLLNINLYPSLDPEERKTTAIALQPVMEKSIISVSFSRGFGLTASQLGVIFVHKTHPLRRQLDTQWQWLTYFYNAIAAKAYMQLNLDKIAVVDKLRRQWVSNWLQAHQLPEVASGSYYVKSFQVEGQIPQWLQPVVRGDLVRLCFKPDIF